MFFKHFDLDQFMQSADVFLESFSREEWELKVVYVLNIFQIFRLK